MTDLDALLPQDQGAVGADWWAQIALPLIPAWLHALEAVVRAPHTRACEVEALTPLRALRRADPDTLRWLARHPEAFRRHRDVPQWQSADTLDHAANRHAAWLIRRVGGALRAAADLLTQGGDTHPHRLARAHLLRLAADCGDTLRTRTSLKQVEASPPDNAALQTIIDDPVYGRVHTLARRFLSPRLTPTFIEPPEREASVDLYALWAFLSLRAHLERLTPGLSWSTLGLSRLPGPSKDEVMAIGCGAAGVLKVWLRPRFDPGAGPRCALSGTHQPALAVSWSPPSRAARWLSLDAGGLDQASACGHERVHTHRDALWWEDQGGRPCAGLWLGVSPKTLPERWTDPAFIDRFDLGAFLMAPGEGDARCARWVLSRLRRQGPASA